MGLVIHNNQPGALGNYVVTHPGRAAIGTMTHYTAGVIIYHDAKLEKVSFELLLDSDATPEAVIEAMHLKGEVADEVTARWEEIYEGHVGFSTGNAN